ncbi:hypothetical protein B0H14DRAFT_2915041 [Mycena olivaceomarginata]|nr:hypothetical protein B0H14DRAFT_2915041 [Mycena olivaceomarginata]
MQYMEKKLWTHCCSLQGPFSCKAAAGCYDKTRFRLPVLMEELETLSAVEYLPLAVYFLRLVKDGDRFVFVGDGPGDGEKPENSDEVNAADHHDKKSKNKNKNKNKGKGRSNEDDNPINEHEEASDDDVARPKAPQTKAKSKSKAKTTMTKKRKFVADTEDTELSEKKSKTSASKPPAIVKPAGGCPQHKRKAPKPFEPNAVRVTGPCETKARDGARR